MRTTDVDSNERQVKFDERECEAIDVKEFLEQVRNDGCVYVELEHEGKTLWLKVVGLKDAGQVIEGGIILQAEPIA